MLLEERKGAPQYKALFAAAPAAMKVDPIKQEEDVKEAEQDAASVDDHYVDIKPEEGTKQEPADGAAAAATAVGPETAAHTTAEAVTFKVVPEYKEVAAGSTSVKVREYRQKKCALCVGTAHLPAAASAQSGGTRGVLLQVTCKSNYCSQSIGCCLLQSVRPTVH
jgi:hypothetical protein